MKDLARLLEHYKVNISKLSRYMGVDHQKLVRLLGSNERVLPIEDAVLISSYLNIYHREKIAPTDLQELVEKRIDNYILYPHGYIGERAYIRGAGGITGDPRPTLQEVIRDSSLKIKDVQEDLNINAYRFRFTENMDIEQISTITEYIEEKTGRYIHPLDVASAYMPLDKIQYER